MMGVSAGWLIGSLIVGLLFLLWYQCFRRHRISAEAKEYVNLLSVVSRATSDDTHYQRRKPPAKVKPSLWTRLLRKIQGNASSSSSSSALASALKTMGPACYLLYEPDSSGRLVKYYSKTPLTGEQQAAVVAVWKPASHISSHKFTQNAGRSVLIGNCNVGFQGKHNYCNGVCQFLKNAFANGGGTITFVLSSSSSSSSKEDATPSFLPIDVYLYLNETRPQYQTLPLLPGKTRTIPSNTLAAACLPHATTFYQNKTVDMYKWLTDAERQGSSIRF